MALFVYDSLSENLLENFMTYKIFTKADLEKDALYVVQLADAYIESIKHNLSNYSFQIKEKSCLFYKDDKTYYIHIKMVQPVDWNKVDEDKLEVKLYNAFNADYIIELEKEKRYDNI